MFDFEFHQISGLQPSLLLNRLRLPDKTLRLLFLKIDLLPNGCWFWRGAKRKGYGAVRIRALSAQVMQLHRVTYQLVYGLLDPTLDLHHKVEDGCVGPSCCNPSHLLPVTKAEHTLEYTPNSMCYRSAHQTSCVAGHPYTPGSMRVLKDGHRQCRICDKDRASGLRASLRVRPKHAKDPETYKTVCLRGHPLSGDNLYFYQTKWGQQWRCRACDVIRTADRIEKGETVQPTKTHCAKGHPMSGDNLGFRRTGYPLCRACALAATMKYKNANYDKVLEDKRRNRARQKALVQA